MESDEEARAIAARLTKAQREAIDEAFWLLAWTWQSHCFHAPKYSLDFSAFAPEARMMMNAAEGNLYDALRRVRAALVEAGQ